MPQLRLYDFPTSPFCIKTRALLRYKGLPFERLNAIAPRHWLRLQTQGTGKVPAIDIDGEFITDSSRIARVLEQRFPTPTALPSDPEQRIEHDQLERWIDDVFHMPALWAHWVDPQGWPHIRGRFPAGWLGSLAANGYRRRIRGQIKARGLMLDDPSEMEAEMRRLVDTASRLLGTRTWLFGEQPTVCDFAWYSQLQFMHRSIRGKQVMRGQTELQRFRRQVHDQFGDLLPPAAWQ